MFILYAHRGVIFLIKLLYLYKKIKNKNIVHAKQVARELIIFLFIVHGWGVMVVGCFCVSITLAYTYVSGGAFGMERK